MDPKHVFLINDNKNSEYLSFNDDKDCYFFNLKSSNLHLAISKNNILSKDNSDQLIYENFHNVITSNIRNFIIHPGSDEEEIKFLINILSWTVSLLQELYEMPVQKPADEFLFELSKIKSIEDVEDNIIYLQIGVVYKNYYMDIIGNEICSCFTPENFTTIKVTSSEHMELAINKYIKDLSEKAHTIIYSLFCKNKTEKDVKYCRYCFIEARDLNHYSLCFDDYNHTRLLALAKEEIKKILVEINAHIEKSCAVISINADEKRSEHIVHLVADLVKEDSLAFNYNHFSEKIKEVKLKHKLTEQKYKSLKLKYEKDIEVAKKSKAREIIDMLSNSHHELLSNQKTRFEQLIQEINIRFEKKIEILTNYYEKKIDALSVGTNQNKFQEIYDNLEESNKANLKLTEEKKELEKQLLLYENSLSDIQKIIKGLPNISTKTNSTKKSKDKIKLETEISSGTITENDDHNENDELYKKIHNLEAQLQVEKEERIKLETKAKHNENQIEKYTFQLNVLNEYKKQDDNAIKSLIEEKFKLSQDLEQMKERHNEQFQKYEKLLKKSNADIDIHKREASLLRQQFMFNKLNIESNPSNKQISNQSKTDKCISTDENITNQTAVDKIANKLATTSVENDDADAEKENKISGGKSKRPRKKGKTNKNN